MDYRKYRLILEVIRGLNAAGSWAGKTHVIKTLYLLKAANGLNIPQNYILYMHGPYSFEVEDDLAMLKMLDAVEEEDRHPGYGASLVVGHNARVIEGQADLTPDEKQRIQQICQAVGTANVKELEARATGAWVWTEEQVHNPDRVAHRVNELKPHIPVEVARKHFESVQRFLS